MRIVVFSDTYPPEINGVATSTLYMKKTFEEHGHEVLIVTTNPFSNEITYEKDIVRIPGLVMKNMFNYRFTWLYHSKVTTFIKKFKPDVLHVQSDLGVGFFGRIISYLLHVPAVYTYHTQYEDYTYYFSDFFKGHFDRLAKNAIRWFVGVIADMADEFITPSKKIKNYLREIGVESYINIIPTGIDFHRFLPQNQDVSALKKKKEELGIDEDTKTLLCLGRVDKAKSVDVVILDYAKYRKAHPKQKMKLLIVGSGPHEEELKNMSKNLGLAKEILFLGKVPNEEVGFYYNLSDIYVSASTSETQGLTYLEAMAARRIVLARYDDNLYNLIESGKNGFFFYDEDDFVKKLELILSLKEEELEKIKDDAFKKMDEYSIEKFYERIKKVYARAIKKNW